MRARTRSWNDEVSDTPGQLATCGEQLLGDERPAAGPLCDDDEHARRWPLVLDRADQSRKLVTAKRWERERGRRAGCGRESDEVEGPRVLPPDRVGLVRPDDRETVRSGDAGQERHQGARGGIGVMDILDDEQHRTALREPTQHA